MFLKTVVAIALLGSVALIPATAAVNTSSNPVSDVPAVESDAILAATTPTSATPAHGLTAAAIPACTGTAGYALNPWRLTSTYKWYYNPTGAPASIAATALTSMQTATKSAFTGKNQCGTTTALTNTDLYSGTTTKAAQVSATGTCTGSDGTSVTSWGNLPANTLAYTCTYYKKSTGAVVESDMLIDNKVHTWFTTMPKGCTNAFDLESVVVHERLHTAGLAHVDATTYPGQVMNPKSLACNTTKRTLGSGDLAGMTALSHR